MAQEYGKVAGSLKTTGFSKKATSAGVWGEQQTAQHLKESFRRDRDVHIFHDLKVPNLDYANIDHVLVKGKTIIVIDSKNWKPGTYWSLGNAGFRGFRPFSGLTKKHVQAAVSFYQKRYKGYKVVGVICVWTRKKNASYTFFTPGLGVKFVRGKQLGPWVNKQIKKDKNSTSTEVIRGMKGSLI